MIRPRLWIVRIKIRRRIGVISLVINKKVETNEDKNTNEEDDWGDFLLISNKRNKKS